MHVAFNKKNVALGTGNSIQLRIVQCNPSWTLWDICKVDSEERNKQSWTPRDTKAKTREVTMKYRVIYDDFQSCQGGWSSDCGTHLSNSHILSINQPLLSSQGRCTLARQGVPSPSHSFQLMPAKHFQRRVSKLKFKPHRHQASVRSCRLS